MSVSEREQLALGTVKRYMMWSAGGALIPIPFVDIAAVLATQLKMLAEISKIYDIPFERNRVKAVVGSLLGYILPEALSEGLFGSLLKTVPGIGIPKQRFDFASQVFILIFRAGLREERVAFRAATGASRLENLFDDPPASGIHGRG